MLGMRFLLY